MDYASISKNTYKHFYAAYESLKESPLDPKIRSLVEIWTSIINGCLFCTDLHTQEGLKAGLSQEKIDELHQWKSSTLFDEKEKLALSWCEIIIDVDADQKGLREEMLKHFSEREFVDITTAASLMNALNRIAIFMR